MKKQEIQNNDYVAVLKKNEQLFYTLLQQVRPDLFVLIDLIDKNKVDIYVIFKILRQLLVVANGNGWGKVIVNIQNNKVTYVEGIDTDRVNSNIFLSNT
jgi:hypothetical protein